MIAGTLTAYAAVSVLAFFMRSQLRQLHSYGAFAVYSKLQILVVLSGHADSFPLLANQYEAYDKAENARQVVDAIVPIEYKIADITDDLKSTGILSVNANSDVDFELKANEFLAQVNAPSPDGATAKKLFTRDNLEHVIRLVGLLLPLIIK